MSVNMCMDDDNGQGADNKGFSHSLSKSSLPPALHGVGVGAKCAHGGGGGTHHGPPREGTWMGNPIVISDHYYFGEGPEEIVPIEVDKYGHNYPSELFGRESGAI